MEESNMTEVQTQEEDSDRISKLPEDILHHILSLVPITTAVQTSVLAKRWESVWTTMPCMEFDEELFYPDGDIPEDPVKFVQFVDSFMERYNSPNIQKFCIASSENCDISRICAWIDAAMSREAQEVEIHVNSERPLQFPESLFTSRFLKVLELGLHSGILKAPRSISLPQLNTLHLVSIKFEDPDWTNKLFPNCPNLENLFMEVCDWDAARVLNISIPGLKTLIINSSPWFYHSQSSIRCVLQICTPKLESFRFRGLMAFEYRIGSLPLLQSATLDFRCCPLRDQDLAPRLRGILKAMGNVKVIYLSSAALELLSSNGNILDNLPVFCNINNLDMHTSFIRTELVGIVSMLHHMPNLHSLAMHFSQVGSSESRQYVTGELNLDFVPPRLKVVKINYLSINWAHIMLVKRILETAEGLEKMIIDLKHMKSGAQALLRQCIEMLPRASGGCELEFTN